MRYLHLMRRVIVLGLLAATSYAAYADEVAEPETIKEPPPPTPFDRGKFSLGIAGGTQSSLGYRYFALGGGVGYFVLDGVEVSLGGQYQIALNDGPTVGKLTPALRYVAQPLVGRWPVIPYVGAFYSHLFIGDGISDVDSVGGRAGFIYVSGKLLLGLGVAYERIVSECVMDCSAIYPDLAIALSL